MSQTRTRSAQIRGGSVKSWHLQLKSAEHMDFPLQLTSPGCAFGQLWFTWFWYMLVMFCHSLSQNYRRGWRSPQVVKAVVWRAYYPGCWCLASSIRRFQYLHGTRIALFTRHNLLSVALSMIITGIVTICRGLMIIVAWSFDHRPSPNIA